MDTRKILSDLRAERDRLNQAIAALESLDRTPGRGRRAKTAAPAGKAAKRRRGRRHLSAATRKRMSEMMKARWAERKKKAKTS